MGDYVDSALQTWGRWLRDGNRTGLGYPACTLHNMIKYGQPIRGSGGVRITPTDETAEMVERFVCQLAVRRPQAAEALRAYYQDDEANYQMVAKRKKWSVAALKRFLTQGRIYVTAGLDTINYAAGGGS